LREDEASLWIFLRVRGIAPTIHAAERALRRAVLWRKMAELRGRAIASLLPIAAGGTQAR
jgi:hypothetical protein